MNDRPKREDYPDMHTWAQAMRIWNEQTYIHSDDLVEQWNKERKNA